MITGGILLAYWFIMSIFAIRELTTSDKEIDGGRVFIVFMLYPFPFVIAIGVTEYLLS